VLSGCATGTAEQEASAAAERFLTAVEGGDAEAACALLTPRTREELAVSDGQPCAESLPADRLGGGATVRDVSVWSGWARVNTDNDALFLAEFETGWLIAAAGCQPNGDAPYQCVVEG
jgi:hypothetical protein